MLKVTFKAKPETVYNFDGTPAYTHVKVPVLTRKHCNIDAFRKSRKFGGFANSDMFPAMLNRAVLQLGIKSHIKLDSIPPCVTIEQGAFLSVVTIEIPDN